MPYKIQPCIPLCCCRCCFFPSSFCVEGTSPHSGFPPCLTYPISPPPVLSSRSGHIPVHFPPRGTNSPSLGASPHLLHGLPEKLSLNLPHICSGFFLSMDLCLSVSDEHPVVRALSHLPLYQQGLAQGITHISSM